MIDLPRQPVIGSGGEAERAFDLSQPPSKTVRVVPRRAIGQVIYPIADKRGIEEHATDPVVCKCGRLSTLVDGENRGGWRTLHGEAEWSFCLTAAELAADQER